MLIALTSAKGAPGTTTSALALALSWPRPVLLADLDPRGGDIVWGFGQGRDTDGRGLLSLHVAARHQPMASAVWSQVISLGDQSWLLPGLDEHRHAGTMDWPGLARALAGLDGVDVIADCGAVPAVKAPSDVWTSADLVVMVVRPTLPAIHAAHGAASLLRTDLMTTGLGADRLTSIIVGPGRPYGVNEVTTAMAGLAPVLGSLPWDEPSASVLSGLREGPRRFAAASLMAKAAKLALDLGGAALDHQRPGRRIAAAGGNNRFQPPKVGELGAPSGPPRTAGPHPTPDFGAAGGKPMPNPSFSAPPRPGDSAVYWGPPPPRPSSTPLVSSQFNSAQPNPPQPNGALDWPLNGGPHR